MQYLVLIGHVPSMYCNNVCACIFTVSGIFGTHFTLDCVSCLKHAASLNTMEVWGKEGCPRH